MTMDQLEDHVVGLELQIVELVERKERAMTQHDVAEAERIQTEIDSLQLELVTTAERIAASHG